MLLCYSSFGMTFGLFVDEKYHFEVFRNKVFFQTFSFSIRSSFVCDRTIIEIDNMQLINMPNVKLTFLFYLLKEGVKTRGDNLTTASVMH